ncbi:MAG: mobile mystery protein B [Acidimicrobiia bacterium]|nr:mobile mystery protein B [Acidimicrobiia bacterium]MYB24709.1 mobile mystery protein B [Acidimicrobiia bacterium]MYE68280.1 mobile mystery protein B [Acidimicrobiia bacterium]MYJ12878.1 mobile mystery protein B [Acidimicrobiia bacterium]
MSDPLLPVGDGHTELTEDDRVGLIPSHIITRGDLSAAEQRNIALALLRRPPSVRSLLDDGYLRNLHRDMFSEVWDWAGRYRLRATNIGIDPSQISVSVRTLVDDAIAWVDHEAYEPDELAVRFHHRLVAIHPFPNGNGRHSRIAADYLVTALGHPRFGWGISLDVNTEDLRAAYHQALQRADAGEIDELLAFARS